MTWGQLGDILSSTGLKCAYHHFNKKTNPPFIAYLQDGRDDFCADNIHYVEISEGVVELYTNIKRTDLERIIELTLTEHKIPFSWQGEVWISSEEVYMVRWAISFLGG